MASRHLQRATGIQDFASDEVRKADVPIDPKSLGFRLLRKNAWNLQVVEYSGPDGAGETVASWNRPTPTMTDVVPGSLGSSWLDAACARARKLHLVK